MSLTLLPAEPGATPEVDAAEAHRVWEDGSAQLVDVREPDEWENARIPRSVHIPLAQLAARQGELDTTKPVVALCHSGVRSLSAAETLQAGGFSEVASLAGGIVGWYQAGYQIED